MIAKEVAQTLLTAARGKGAHEQRELVNTLVAHLRQTRRLFLLPAVLRECEGALARGGTIPTLILADEKEGTRLKTSIIAAIEHLGVKEAPKTTIDSSLIAGFTLSYAGKRIDQSGKRRLLDLYTNLTT